MEYQGYTKTRTRSSLGNDKIEGQSLGRGKWESGFWEGREERPLVRVRGALGSSWGR